MSITNYAELRFSVGDWLHRTDLQTQVEDFISLAEDELNTELRLRLMEVDETVTLLGGTRSVAIPDGFLEPVKLELVYGDGSDNQELQYLTMPQFVRSAATMTSVEPRYWTINGANLEFPEPADRDYTLIFRMLKKFDIASTDTNALLDSYKGLYLYGALLQAAPYMRDDSRIPTWQLMFDRLKAKVMKKEARTKTLAILLTDTPSRPYHSNIFRG
jgi:hypothetical protein